MNRLYDFFLRPVRIVRDYRPSNLRPDLFAGLTSTMIVLPQAIAYALIAGLPPQYGLYAAIVATLVGALWGSSNQMQKGPTNTSSLLTLSALAFVAAPGTPEYLAGVGILGLMVGLIQLATGLLRLGALVRFVSDSVVVGFTAGAGFLIFANQLHNLLGLRSSATAELLETLRYVWQSLPTIHLPSLALGLATMLAIIGLRRANRRLPASLLAMVGASVLVAIVRPDVRVVGELPRSLPPFEALPLLDLDLLGRLATPALSIAAIGVVEAVSIGRVMAGRTGQRLDSNQEFVGLGLANVACAFFSGYPSSASFTRSAVNLQAGARSPFASVFTSLLVLLTLVTLAPLAAYIPMAALAGVLVVTAYDLIDRREADRIWRGSASDRAIMVVTFVCTLLLPLHFAVLTGIGMSLGAFLLRTSQPRVRFLVPDTSFNQFEAQGARPACPQLGVVEVMGDLYFGAVQHIEESVLTNMERNPSQRFLLLRLHSVDSCDISGVHMLESLTRLYRGRGGQLFLTRVRRPVLDTLRAAGFLRTLGAERVLGSAHAISDLFYHVLDPAVCIYECPLRVFKECQDLPKQLGGLSGDLLSTCHESELDFVEPRAVWRALQSQSPPLVLDVREPREYARGHVPKAQSLPLPGLLSGAVALPQSESVVLVCRSGRRSIRAACALREQGRANVQVVKGGMLAWEAANLLEAIEPYERESTP